MKNKAAKLRPSRFSFDDYNLARELFGPQDKNISLIEKSLGVEISIRGSDVIIQGASEDIHFAERVLTELYQLLKSGMPVTSVEIEQAMRILSHDSKVKLESIFKEHIYIPSRKKGVTPRSESQRKYIHAIQENDLVFGIGPAGTGKTYLAVAVAVSCLLRGDVKKMILARPAVEAGERLGFLPGDMQAKVDPYLRPLYDSLYDLLSIEEVDKMIEKDQIEIAPLAFMRGRTLHSSFIILDEAQNCSGAQMKMCLTRMGLNSKMVVTGDITQIDLPANMVSGLVETQRVLSGIEGIAFHYFTEVDVVRHDLVRRVVRAYDKK